MSEHQRTVTSSYVCYKSEARSLLQPVNVNTGELQEAN